MPVRGRPPRLFRRGTRWRRFQLGLSLLIPVLAFGTCGYMVVGLSPFDALYQTAITISTVGYGEVGPRDEIDRAYRAFTLMLVIVGASSAVYTATVLLETLVEGTLDDGIRRRRMQRRIDGIEGHVIVAGWGRVGRAIADYARRHDMTVVAIDNDPGQVAEDILAVGGDATEEETLRAAGIERAASLIAAIGSDNDNLFLTLTARSMRQDLLVVARVADRRNETKFLRAGADRVVNPYAIGGSRMAAIAFRPHVAEFLDEVIHAEEHDVDIHEMEVEAGSRAEGARLADVAGGDSAAAVIAVKDTDGHYVFNPPADRALATGDILIAVGSAEQLALLAEVAAPSS
jgi:voltage-gated potassium channel